uniref:Uncharacterized protein n=1 Tax=viral metagenome TaxID=1070528 RepID=A0A6C0F1G4_9ZZZZ
MLNTAGVIVIIIMLIYLIYSLHGNSLDSFIVFIDDVVIPNSCYNYLVTNGKNYFLLNTKKILDGVTNPLSFNNKNDALEYLKNAKCPVNIPFVDLVMRKKLEDPTVSFQRECNTKISPNLFDLDTCSTYGSNNDTLSGKYLAKLNKIENDKKQYSNYDLESCMINKATTEDPGLEDTQFTDYFAKYFDRLNSNIDEQYLYISGR